MALPSRTLSRMDHRMNIPVLSVNGTRIGTIDTTEAIADEIANVAAHGGGKLLVYPTLYEDGLVSVTLAFEPAKPSGRPRLIWCPPGCEEAAMGSALF
jgi:hypothetical protein